MEQHIVWIVVNIILDSRFMTRLSNLGQLFSEIDTLLIGNLRRLPKDGHQYRTREKQV